MSKTKDMPKHTPGPWEVFVIPPGQYDNPEEGFRIWAYPFGRHSGPVGVGSVNRIGDANLISAAPKMLDVLNAVRFAVQMDMPMTDAWVGLLNDLDSVIAEALGQAEPTP